jgi:uncharacterized protein (DUF427 family)
MEHLEKKNELRQGADTVRWRVEVRDRVAQNAARAYIKPAGDRAALEGHLTFYWDHMDAWFEEDEEIFVHPRDPCTRVDTVHSSRHVRVEIDGATLAETHRSILLFETGLPTRYYMPKQDVRVDLLEPLRVRRKCSGRTSGRARSASSSPLGHAAFKSSDSYDFGPDTVKVGDWVWYPYGDGTD